MIIGKRAAQQRINFVAGAVRKNVVLSHEALAVVKETK